MHGMDQSDEQAGHPALRDKRTRIGKANGSTDRSSGPDAMTLQWHTMTLSTAIRKSGWVVGYTFKFVR
jgi:hypothetical protein